MDGKTLSLDAEGGVISLFISCSVTTLDDENVNNPSAYVFIRVRPPVDCWTVGGVFEAELTALTRPAFGSVPLLPTPPPPAFVERVKATFTATDGLDLSWAWCAADDKTNEDEAGTTSTVLLCLFDTVINGAFGVVWISVVYSELV